MFGRLKQHKSTTFRVDADINIAQLESNPSTPIDSGFGVTVDSSCKTIITIKCLQQLYNTVGVNPSDTKENSIGVTGYLVRILPEL